MRAFQAFEAGTLRADEKKFKESLHPAEALKSVLKMALHADVDIKCASTVNDRVSRPIEKYLAATEIINSTDEREMDMSLPCRLREYISLQKRELM